MSRVDVTRQVGARGGRADHDYVPGTWPRQYGSPLDGPLRDAALTMVRRGFSQMQIARELGCTDRTVLRWLKRDTEAARLYDSDEIALLRLTLIGQAPASHGTTTRYNRHGCRCQDCRDASAAAHWRYTERRRAREAPK